MGLLSDCNSVFGRLGSTVQCEQLSPRQLGIRALLLLRGIHGDQRVEKRRGLYLCIRLSVKLKSF